MWYQDILRGKFLLVSSHRLEMPTHFCQGVGWGIEWSVGDSMWQADILLLIISRVSVQGALHMQWLCSMFPSQVPFFFILNEVVKCWDLQACFAYIRFTKNLGRLRLFCLSAWCTVSIVISVLIEILRFLYSKGRFLFDINSFAAGLFFSLAPDRWQCYSVKSLPISKLLASRVSN